MAVMKPPDRLASAPAVRRRLLGLVPVAAVAAGVSRRVLAVPDHPNRRWYDAAQSMRQLALTWGDEPYGAVVVFDGFVAGEGPSRVIRDSNPDAHAEREAIRDAQRRLGKEDMSGAVLYSTSQPCRLCEAAAARAKVSRMYFGPDLVDAGSPKP